MKTFLIGITLLLGISISSGCQSSSQKSGFDHEMNNQETTSEILAPEVQIIAKEQVEKGQKEAITAIVTLGNEFVNEAEVEFEIKHGEDSEKIVANFVKDGEYVIEYIFKSEGQYEVIAHTNAEGYHIMPTVQIQVGDPVTSPQPNDKSEMTEHHHNHEE